MSPPNIKNVEPSNPAIKYYAMVAKGCNNIRLTDEGLGDSLEGLAQRLCKKDPFLKSSDRGYSEKLVRETLKIFIKRGLIFQKKEGNLILSGEIIKPEFIVHNLNKMFGTQQNKGVKDSMPKKKIPIKEYPPKVDPLRRKLVKERAIKLDALRSLGESNPLMLDVADLIDCAGKEGITTREILKDFQDVVESYNKMKEEDLLAILTFLRKEKFIQSQGNRHSSRYPSIREGERLGKVDVQREGEIDFPSVNLGNSLYAKEKRARLITSAQRKVLDTQNIENILSSHSWMFESPKDYSEYPYLDEEFLEHVKKYERLIRVRTPEREETSSGLSSKLIESSLIKSDSHPTTPYDLLDEESQWDLSAAVFQYLSVTHKKRLTANEIVQDLRREITSEYSESEVRACLVHLADEGLMNNAYSATQKQITKFLTSSDI